jgi:hypothetical protein
MLDHLACEPHGFGFNSVAPRLGQACDNVINTASHFSPLDYVPGFYLPQMQIEPPVRDFDQPFVKPLLIPALLFSGNQHYGGSVRIKRKSRPPDFTSAVCAKAQLLHVRVLRAVKGSDMRPARFRAGDLHCFGGCQQVVLHVFFQRLEFGIEFVMK